VGERAKGTILRKQRQDRRLFADLSLQRED
jgi:hypothetical protein